MCRYGPGATDSKSSSLCCHLREKPVDLATYPQEHISHPGMKDNSYLVGALRLRVKLHLKPGVQGRSSLSVLPFQEWYGGNVFKGICRLSVKVAAALCTGIEYWRFLDNWRDCLPWRTEHHAVIMLYCDASKRAWGGTLLKDGRSLESRDYWIDNLQDINILEAWPLLHSLLSFRHHISSCRVDVHTDSLVLKSALKNDGCRNSSVNNILRHVFIAAENSISALTYIIFLQVQTWPISLPGKFQTWIVCCQRGLGSRLSIFLGPTPLTLCLRIVIVNTMERGRACPTLHLVQLRVLAESTFLHSQTSFMVYHFYATTFFQSGILHLTLVSFCKYP